MKWETGTVTRTEYFAGSAHRGGAYLQPIIYDYLVASDLTVLGRDYIISNQK